MFVYLNANPSSKSTGDCVVRAISVLENQNAPCTNDEVARLREDFDKLRKELDDFIK